MLVCGEREAVVIARPPTCDSVILPCFHGCLAFLHRHTQPQSPLSHPFSPSLPSKQQPSAWNCPRIPKLQLPATVRFRGHISLSGVCTAAATTLWFSFYLGFHRSVVSLSALNVYSMIQIIDPMWDWTPASLPSPTQGRSSPTNTPVFFFFFPQFFHPTEFCMVLYILFHLSGAPVYFPVMFWLLFCVWRCMPDVSMERCTPHPPIAPPSCSLVSREF